MQCLVFEAFSIKQGCHFFPPSRYNPTLCAKTRCLLLHRLPWRCRVADCIVLSYAATTVMIAGEAINSWSHRNELDGLSSMHWNHIYQCCTIERFACDRTWRNVQPRRDSSVCCSVVHAWFVATFSGHVILMTVSKTVL